jgi:hypothetical protein
MKLALVSSAGKKYDVIDLFDPTTNAGSVRSFAQHIITFGLPSKSPAR